MDKKYYKRFCECEDWKRTDRGGDYEKNKLYELLKHYPNECPYCHSKLKTRLREIDVHVGIECEIGGCVGTGGGVPIPLEDFKELLKGGENARKVS